jgi:nicotinamide riboside kinase
MKKLMIIVGPQSSGKTTLFNFLKTKIKKALFLEEINPFTLVGKKHLGGAFVDLKLEKQIINEDLKRLKKIVYQPSEKELVIEETGIFHLIYLKKLANEEICTHYFQKYFRLYNKIFPLIIFIDTKPQISWQRRKQIYLSRLKNITDQKQKKLMLKKYREKIFELYPQWHWLYRYLPFKKIIIKNSYKKKRDFLKEALKIVDLFLHSKNLFDKKIHSIR